MSRARLNVQMCVRGTFAALLFMAMLPVWCVSDVRAEECNGYPGHYCKLADPPDVEKAGGPGSDLTCWLATAANMLAGAGYGTGETVQQRAEDIYADLTEEFGTLE